MTKRGAHSINATAYRWWTSERHDELERLRRLEGWTFDEIAERMGSTPTAVKVQTAIMGFTLTPQAILNMKERGTYRRKGRKSGTGNKK